MSSGTPSSSSVVTDNKEGDQEPKNNQFVIIDDVDLLSDKVTDLFAKGRHFNIFPVLPRIPHPLEVIHDMNEQKMKLQKLGVKEYIFVKK